MTFEDHYFMLVFDRKLINILFFNFDYDKILAGFHMPSFVLIISATIIILTYFYSLYFFIQEKQYQKSIANT